MKKVFGIFQSQQIRNALLNLTGILLAMLAAGLLGRIASEAVISQINDGLTKLIMGIVIGMLIGLAVGMLVHRVWGRLVGIVS